MGKGRSPVTQIKTICILTAIATLCLLAFPRESSAQKTSRSPTVLLPDGTYGRGGWKIIDSVKVSRDDSWPDTTRPHYDIAITFLDSSAKKREVQYIIAYNDGAKEKKVQTSLFNCEGNRTSHDIDEFDSSDNQLSHTHYDVDTKTGGILDGWKWMLNVYGDKKYFKHKNGSQYENAWREISSTTPFPETAINVSNTPCLPQSPSNSRYSFQIPTFEIAGGIGYSVPFNPSLIGRETSFSGSSGSVKGVYGSWGAGPNFYIAPTFRMCQHTAAGLEFSYTSGKNYSWTTSSNTSTFTMNQNYESHYIGFKVTPFAIFYPCEVNQWYPYIKLAVPLNVYNVIKQTSDQTQTNSSGTTHTDQTGTLKGEFTAGFDAAFGLQHRLSKRCNVDLSLNLHNSRFMPSTWKIDSYTVNGSDKLSALNLFQKQTDYVKSYTTAGSTTNPNAPQQQLKYSDSESSVGLRVGIRYTLITHITPRVMVPER